MNLIDTVTHILGKGWGEGQGGDNDSIIIMPATMKHYHN